MLPNIMWRPTNLTSLANANLTTDSTKPPAFLGTVVSILMSTYFIYSGWVLGNVSTLWTVIGYFSLALLVINIPTVKKISAVAENLARCESKFKFTHSRVRLHAETIALYGAEDIEKSEISRSFDEVIENSKLLIAWQSLFQSLQVLFQYAPFLVSGTPMHPAAARSIPAQFARSANCESFCGRPEGDCGRPSPVHHGGSHGVAGANHFSRCELRLFHLTCRPYSIFRLF
jgi:ABC-type uncharacterized transport system fused permease/ATPase subunit